MEHTRGLLSYMSIILLSEYPSSVSTKSLASRLTEKGECEISVLHPKDNSIQLSKAQLVISDGTIQFEVIAEFALKCTRDIYSPILLAGGVRQTRRFGLRGILNKHEFNIIQLCRFGSDGTVTVFSETRSAVLEKWKKNKSHIGSQIDDHLMNFFGHFLTNSMSAPADIFITKVEKNSETALGEAYYYLSRIGKRLKHVGGKLLLGRRKTIWRIAYGHGPLSILSACKAKVIEAPEGRYYADPFAWDQNGKKYVFFENYCRRKKQATLSAAELINGNLIEAKDILVRDHHLSYPFLFCHRNDIFMIPETSKAKSLELWKCDQFPYDWSLHKVVFKNISVADSSVFQDKNDDWWLFANISNGTPTNHDTSLHVFKLDGPEMSSITPHQLNPVIVDASCARGAGTIFIDEQNRIIRPAQKNINGTYGAGLVLREITSLSLTKYEEHEVELIMGSDLGFADGLHHYSQFSDGSWVIDIKSY